LVPLECEAEERIRRHCVSQSVDRSPRLSFVAIYNRIKQVCLLLCQWQKWRIIDMSPYLGVVCLVSHIS